MAEKQIILVGDSTTHGGTVLEGFATFKIAERRVAGRGHKVRCPKCQGTFVIAEGETGDEINGVPIALEGMRTSCGATLVASQFTSSVEKM